MAFIDIDPSFRYDLGLREIYENERVYEVATTMFPVGDEWDSDGDDELELHFVYDKMYDSWSWSLFGIPADGGVMDSFDVFDDIEEAFDSFKVWCEYSGRGIDLDDYCFG